MNIVLYDLDKYDLDEVDSIYRYMKKEMGKFFPSPSF